METIKEHHKMSLLEKDVFTQIDKYYESTKMRVLIRLFLIQPNWLTKQAQSIASLAVKKLVDNKVPIHLLWKAMKQ